MPEVIQQEGIEAMINVFVLCGCTIAFHIRQEGLPCSISMTYLPPDLFSLYSLLTPLIALRRGYSWCPELTGFYGIGYGGKSVALCFELYTSIIIPSINFPLCISNGSGVLSLSFHINCYSFWFILIVANPMCYALTESLGVRPL